MVQHSGGVQLYDLVVLHRQVMAGAFQVSDLLASTGREEGHTLKFSSLESKERKRQFIAVLFNSCCYATYFNHTNLSRSNLVTNALIKTQPDTEGELAFSCTVSDFTRLYPIPGKTDRGCCD